MPNRIALMMIALTGMLTGCARIPMQASLSDPSPVNSTARDGSYPPAMPVLMAGTNFAMGPAADEQKMPMDKSMPMDKPMPMDKSMKH